MLPETPRRETSESHLERAVTRGLENTDASLTEDEEAFLQRLASDADETDEE